MKKTELVKILKFLNSYYQNRFEYPKETKEDTRMLQETWYMFLQEYDYQLVQVALKKLVIEKEWPPTPGEIIKEIENIRTPESEKLTAGEAWSMVLEAIQRYGTAYGTEKAMNSLPPKVRRAVECVGGLRVIGMSNAEETYMMNQFCKVYNELSDKYDRQARLPESVRRETAKLAEKFKRPAIEGHQKERSKAELVSDGYV
ncbi:MAG: hypothetical protein PWR10_1810 [Halanaerobiales bacterium]|nr:hypothetical protein [Halanaerobiales bacterium]